MRNIGDIGTMSPEVEAQYPILRLVVKGVLRYSELETMSLAEVESLGAIYDMQEDMQTVVDAYYNEKMEKESK